jgi:TM2 domain-containing membrane protein YozV
MFEALNLNTKHVQAEEESIRLAVRELPDEQRLAFYTQLADELKDPDTYAMLNYFFLTGLHHMYLGKYGRGAINLSLLLAGLAVAASGAVLFGILIVFFIVCVELLALFRSQVVVQDYNNTVSRHILRRVTSTTQPSAQRRDR